MDCLTLTKVAPASFAAVLLACGGLVGANAQSDAGVETGDSTPRADVGVFEANPSPPIDSSISDVEVVDSTIGVDTSTDADGGDGLATMEGGADDGSTMVPACPISGPCDGGGALWQCEGGAGLPNCTYVCVCDAVGQIYCNLGCQ